MPKTELTDEDIAAFREAVKDVRPLKKTNKINFKKILPKAKVDNIQSEIKPIEDFLSDHITTTVHAEEKLFFARDGLQHTLIRDLRQGKIIPAARLDLHKMTVVMARQAVTEFLANSLNQSYRCVLIIHGKGKLNIEAPILKNHLNSWLQQYPGVLAFCSASPREGGVGAVYVLLRRRK